MSWLFKNIFKVNILIFIDKIVGIIELMVECICGLGRSGGKEDRVVFEMSILKYLKFLVVFLF